VSQHLGLSKSTLRFWEKEFGTCIRPQRTAGGQRRYNVNNINLFEIIHNLKQQGLKLSDIKNQLSLRQFCNEGLDSTVVDQLANRIAEAVRREIIIFFRKEA
jgi:DNA-binding transcriptional MerR regulator